MNKTYDYYDDCKNPEKIISVERKMLWNLLVVLLTVDFDLRDQRWERAVDEVKQLLHDSV